MDPTMPPADAGNTGRGHAMLSAGIVFIILATACIIGRFWSRYKKGAGLGWDDWIIAVALPFYVAQMGLSWWGVYGCGLGAHGNMEQQVATAKELTIIQYPYAMALFLVRMSICALYLRIFIQQWVKIFVYIYVFLASSWLIFLYVMPPAACQPFEANWDKTIPGATCNSVALLNSYTVNGVWSIILDVIIWALPQGLVWRLEMGKGVKIALSAVFALGVFDIVVAGVRLAEVRQTSFTDLSYTNWPAQFWSCIEVGVAIVIACLPQCKPVFELIIPKSWLTGTASRMGIGKSGGDYDGRSAPINNPGARHSKRPDAYRELDEDAIELTASLKGNR